MRLEHLPADTFELSPLAREALANRPHPAALPGVIVPACVADVPRPAERFDADQRRALASALELRLAKQHVAVLDSVRAIAEPGTAVVIAGQQPAFLGGPLYDLYKALHAIRLARELSAAWGSAVVPVFWNHADDHDIAEVHHLHVVNPNLDLRKVVLPGMSSGKRPFSDIVLRAEEHRLGPIAELLRQLLPAAAARDDAIATFLPRDGESLASAFTRAFTTLLGAQGLVVIEPGWIRESLSRHLAALVGADPLPNLCAGAEALRGAGQEVAIDPSSAALVFHHVDGKRLALRAGGDGFHYDDEPGSRTPAELAAEILQSPADWSAGGLLRPIVQDLALPVCAYVGGWGELAYHAQLPPLREAANAPPAVFVPRLSVTLLDKETEASLERLELGLLPVLRGALAVDASEAVHTPVAGSLRRIAASAAGELGGLRQELSELDPGLGVQLKRSAKQLTDLIEKLAVKADRVHANRSGKGRRHHRRLASYLLPRNQPQERVLGTLQFAARFGYGWIAELLSDIDPFACEHLVMHLEQETP